MNKNKIDWKKTLNVFIHNAKLMFALFLIIAPLQFVWITELVMTYNGAILTNGFRDYDGLQHYHLAMYFMFFVTFVGSLTIIKNEINYIRGKV